MNRGLGRTAMGGLLATLTLSPCLAQQLPGAGQPANVAATVMSMRGRVSVMRGSTPWTLDVGDVVKAREMITTGTDGYAIFQVNDGSTFEVFPSSRVIFRNTYNFEELVDMVIGRIKVHIQKWGGQPNHNRINTPTAVISVRGTTFDVEVDQEDSTLIVVEEGQVGVRHRLMLNDGPLKLVNGGEQLRVYKNVPLAKSRVDKGLIMQRGANALAEAFYNILLRGPRLGGGGSGGPAGVPGGGPTSGDTTGGGSAPAPPPPPPPPPPGGSGGPAPPPGP